MPSKRGRFRDHLDRTIFAKSWEGPSSSVEVSVHSYAGGKPRLQFARKKAGRRTRGSDYTRLGRLTRQEAEGILPIFQEALHHM